MARLVIALHRANLIASSSLSLLSVSFVITAAPAPVPAGIATAAAATGVDKPAIPPVGTSPAGAVLFRRPGGIIDW